MGHVSCMKNVGSRRVAARMQEPALVVTFIQGIDGECRSEMMSARLIRGSGFGVRSGGWLVVGGVWLRSRAPWLFGGTLCPRLAPLGSETLSGSPLIGDVPLQPRAFLCEHAHVVLGSCSGVTRRALGESLCAGREPCPREGVLRRGFGEACQWLAHRSHRRLAQRRAHGFPAGYW